MASEKPKYPEDYVLPEVWSPPTSVGGTFGAVNQPTAGARYEEALPKGDKEIQLYSLATPNGIKVAIMLEELGAEYDAHTIKIMGEKPMQFSSGFVEINPNSKIPAMVDYSQTPPLRVFESGNMLLYLAEKHGKFLPKELAARTECLNWLFWQMGSAPFVGGGFGHFFKYAPLQIKYAIDRYTMEVKRQLDVLDKQLEGKEYVCGEYTIADMAIYPWVFVHKVGYNSATFLELDSYKNVTAWIDRMAARPAVIKGITVTPFA
eukprot:CAMPEP_0178411072 /NCGR_PEP_ID=MMETSP0689_2-20121128/21307_1 /TAXON_ID=160604 /ORGANISM="Amphidinium massartii, Strain CS-259" /LENGTH=261 /DNA_ID=CAMNT_0020032269 /DNA_START=88 /DNA_END=873 /DNA_ORIENTATION=+